MVAGALQQVTQMSCLAWVNWSPMSVGMQATGRHPLETPCAPVLAQATACGGWLLTRRCARLRRTRRRGGTGRRPKGGACARCAAQQGFLLR